MIVKCFPEKKSGIIIKKHFIKKISGKLKLDQEVSSYVKILTLIK